MLDLLEEVNASGVERETGRIRPSVEVKSTGGEQINLVEPISHTENIKNQQEASGETEGDTTLSTNNEPASEIQQETSTGRVESSIVDELESAN